MMAYPETIRTTGFLYYGNFAVVDFHIVTHPSDEELAAEEQAMSRCDCGTHYGDVGERNARNRANLQDMLAALRQSDRGWLRPDRAADLTRRPKAHGLWKAGRMLAA